MCVCVCSVEFLGFAPLSKLSVSESDETKARSARDRRGFGDEQWLGAV